MSLSVRSIVRGIGKGCLGLVLLLLFVIGGLFLAYWITGREDVTFEWDTTVENNTGKSLDLYAQDGKHRGVSLMATERIYASDLDLIVRSNVEWLAIHPYALQPKGFNSPEIDFDPSGVLGWGIRDSALVVLAGHAKEAGLKIFLKPHLWLQGGEEYKWRSEIEMDSEDVWQAWFENYSAFILHYAQLADSLQIEMLSIGTELQRAALTREADWRVLIEKVRSVYGGELTYAANWYEEYEFITFWDDLDAIGVQAYFPLTDKKDPSVEELIAGWQPHKEKLHQFSQEIGKPIVFTEVGYKSVANAAIEPWEWLTLKSYVIDRLSVKTQEIAYQALFEVFWEEPWFKGIYVWRWSRRSDRVDIKDRSFFVQNKPAQLVIARHFKSIINLEN